MTDNFNKGKNITAIALLIAQGEIPGNEISEIWEDIDGEVSPRSRRNNKPHSFDSACARLSQHHFPGNSAHDKIDFERKFQMSCVVLHKVLQTLLRRSIFKRRTDAMSKDGICPLVFMVVVLCILAFGKSYDKTDEFCEMSRTSAWAGFFSFITEMVATFDAEYPRISREKDCHWQEIFWLFFIDGTYFEYAFVQNSIILIMLPWTTSYLIYGHKILYICIGTWVDLVSISTNW